MKPRIIQPAEARPNLIKMCQRLLTQDNILAVTALDIWAEFGKAFLNHFTVVIVKLRTADYIRRIKMHRELLSVDCFHKLHIRIHQIRLRPRHHLKSKKRSLRLHIVNDPPRNLHYHIERLVRQVVFMRSRPVVFVS